MQGEGTAGVSGENLGRKKEGSGPAWGPRLRVDPETDRENSKGGVKKT